MFHSEILIAVNAQSRYSTFGVVCRLEAKSSACRASKEEISPMTMAAVRGLGLPANRGHVVELPSG